MVEANEDLAGRLARVKIERECTGGPISSVNDVAGLVMGMMSRGGPPPDGVLKVPARMA